VDEGFFVFDKGTRAMERADPVTRENFWKSFFPIWVIANAFGCMLFGLLVSIRWFSFEALFGVSVILGICQWAILRMVPGVDWTWILTSIPSNIALFIGSYDARRSIPVSLFEFIISLAILGFFQWLILRQYVDRAKHWLYLIPLAVLLSRLLVAFFLTLSNPPQAIGPLLNWLLNGLLYGAASGAVLIKLMTMPGLSKKGTWFDYG
jgi:hypothetical protein